MEKPISFTLTDIIAAAKTMGGSAAFVKALGFTLPQEGIYLELVAGDSGGLTCCGVDQDDYDHFRKQMGEAKQSVALITAAEVAGCYHHNHWQPLGCDNYQYPVALALFDDGVNQGNEQSIRNLQRALVIPADGILGSGTIAAEHAAVVKYSAAELMHAMLTQRRAIYVQIAKNNADDVQFLSDWLRRCDDLAASAGN